MHDLDSFADASSIDDSRWRVVGVAGIDVLALILEGAGLYERCLYLPRWTE